MTPVVVRRIGRAAVIVVAALVVVSGLVAVLEANGIDDASPAYLLAVVATGVTAGAWPAVATAIGAFLIHDLLFVQPRFTLTVDDPGEWFNLLLLLVVGIVVGRLAGRERDRADAAIAREREATAMFRVSFALAGGSTADAWPRIVAVLRDVAEASRVWVEVGDRVVADTGDGPRPAPSVYQTLSRRPDDEPAVWTRVHAPIATSGRRAGAVEADVFRVGIDAGDDGMGAIWIVRPRGSGPPGSGATRVLAAAADQAGRALERDRLAAEAAAAEASRRGDALKSALLDSVSHDLRTPLASIRATAGMLMDPSLTSSDAEREALATSIDLEADRLDRIVSNLLDMSRIEAGGLQPTTAAFVLEDLVSAAIARSAVAERGAGDQRRVEVDIPDDLPPVEVDEVLFDGVLGNLLDNADRYAGSGARVRVSARALDDTVAMTVEDDGPGVPDEALPRLFEKFYRAPRAGEGSRRGTGTGLAVVQGLLDAMGGSAGVRRSELGGLAVDLRIPVARLPDPGA